MLNLTDPRNHLQYCIFIMNTKTWAMVGINTLPSAMAQNSVMELHLLNCLHDPHAPFSEKCHSLVTEWALGQSVYPDTLKEPPI